MRSARRLREALTEQLGLRRLGVVITDTFGRPWREGLVDVAIGVAGMPAAVDLRGTADHAGRELEVTVMALADQIAAAAGIVMGKAERVPAAVVRGIDWDGDAGAASELVRSPTERPLPRIPPAGAARPAHDPRVRPGHGAARGRGRGRRRGLHGARPAPHAPLALRRARRRAGEARAARRDRRGVARRPARRTPRQRTSSSGGWPAAMPCSAPRRPSSCPSSGSTARTPTPTRSGRAPSARCSCSRVARRSRPCCSALHDQGYASCWISSTLFCQEETRAVLGLDDGWYALGTVACGPMPEGGAGRPRPPIDPSDFLRWS